MIGYVNFEKDLEEIVSAMFQHSLGSSAQPLGPYRQFAQLFDHADRLVPEKRYTVNLSEELRGRTDWFPPRGALLEVITRLEQGQTILPYLPKKIKFDRLHGHWRIKHLHLKSIDTVGKDRLVERSNNLLFFRVEGDGVYLIDILPHPPRGSRVEWANTDLVKIVDRNWPGLHHVISSPAQPGSSLDDEMFADLRSKNVNAAVSTDRGSVFVGGGTMMTGESLRAHTEWMLLRKRIDRVQAYVAHKYAKLFPSHQSYASALRLDELHDTGCVIFDGASQRHAFIQDAAVDRWYEISFPRMKFERGAFITHHSA